MSSELMGLIIAGPLLGGLAAAVWPNHARNIGLLSLLLASICAIALFSHIALTGHEANQLLGGWQAGLAIKLHADALSALMLALTAVAAIAVSIYATRYFGTQQQAARFWPLWLLLVSALNVLFLSADLFNIYVALELLGLSAVALTALGGKRESIKAALRYLLVGLLGSMSYLAGVAILYTALGTLDMQLVSQRISVDVSSALALLLMTGGLLLKTALFPLHFWLPAAHSNAPAPVSAALSALVVKAGFYLVLRLWTEVYPPALTPPGAILVGALGCAAILWGSWQALRAERLKLLAAYSTVAQLGYLFVGLALLVTTPPGEARDVIFGALVLMAITHGLAKSSLFLAIGVVQQHAGHDRVDQLDGTSQSLPATTFALALAGVALIGLPPSGAFLGKWHLLNASMDGGLWPVVLVVAVGSLLAAAYIFRVLGHAFGSTALASRPVNVAAEEWPALGLGLLATVFLGLGSAWLWDLMEVAR